MQCYRCHQWGHKANDPKCPLYNQRRSSDSLGEPAPEQGELSKPPIKNKLKDPWKYIEPKDLTQPVIIKGKKWYFCTKCRCRSSRKVGFYQLLHTDATHDPNWRPQGNLTPVTDPDPTPAASIRLLINRESELDEDDLVFTGVNCTPILRTFNLHTERENGSRMTITHRERSQLDSQTLLSQHHRHVISVNQCGPFCEPHTKMVPNLHYTPVLPSRCSECVPSTTNHTVSYTRPLYLIGKNNSVLSLCLR